MDKKEAKKTYIDLTGKNVRSVEEILTGFSNNNFLINDSSVMRIPKENKDETISNANELNNYNLIAPLNLSEKIIYFDIQTGIKISKFIHQSNPYDLSPTNDQLTLIAKTLKKLHNSKINTKVGYQPFLKLNVYKKSLDISERIDSRYEKLIIQEISKIFGKSPMVLCHNDLVKGNMLFTYNKLFLIDWEYGAMNNPYFDLASVITENDLSNDQEAFFLQKYFGSKYNNLIKKRVDLFGKFQDILFYYRAKYMLNRRHLQIYKTIGDEKYQRILNSIKTLF
jgi:thiamine kinase-like enzyme